MRRLLLLSLALTALAAWPISAGAHEKASAYSSAFASYFGNGDPVGMLGADGLAAPQELTGTGQNMRIIANVPMAGSVAASDLELAGDYAYVGSYGEGMVIVDIKDPYNPKRAGVFDCPGGQNDIQLQPGSDPQYAVMAIEFTSNTCGAKTEGQPKHAGDEGFVVIDISDKTKPREVAFVGQTATNGNVVDGAHNTTLDFPYVYVNQFSSTYNRFDIFDIRQLIANPAQPKVIGTLNARGQGSHDLQVDHRPDGKVYAYSASIGFTDVLDVTDPTKPSFVQRFTASEHGVGISHGLEPNFDRTVAIESDEFGGGSGLPGCGGGDASGSAPAGALSVTSPGALHFLDLEPAGQFKTLPGSNNISQRGTFNLAPQQNANPDAGCTAHVFWQAPDENRLTVAWYGRGTRIVDFSDPDKPRELGHFIPKGAETWSAKPHKGFIFAGDTVRGLDVLEYTGEDCSRWPTTSGAAEVQRDRYQGSAFKVGGLTRTDAAKSTPPRTPVTPATATAPAACAAPPVSGGAQQCRDNDPAPTLPDAPGTGGTGGTNCQPNTGGGGGGGGQGQGAQPSTTTTQPTACQSNAGFSRATARGTGRNGGLTFEFARAANQPVTVDVFRQSRGRRITGERLVKRFTGKTSSFTWNGRDDRGRKVGNGFYFARFRTKGTNGQVDTVRVTLGRSNGRFGPRRAYYGRDRCGTLAKFKLSRPVFGGTQSRRLGIAYKLNQAARVQVTVTNRRERVIKRFSAKDVPANATQRLSLSPRGLERGEYRVKISVTRNGSTSTSTLTSTRL